MSGQKLESRTRRKLRIRQRVHGTVERPRLTVFRSLKHVYAQVIDDDAQRTLCHASTLGAASAELFKGMSKTAQAKKLGELLAASCKEQGIARVVFDRNGYLYHGRVRAVAAGAREGGLDF